MGSFRERVAYDGGRAARVLMRLADALRDHKDSLAPLAEIVAGRMSRLAYDASHDPDDSFPATVADDCGRTARVFTELADALRRYNDPHVEAADTMAVAMTRLAFDAMQETQPIDVAAVRQGRKKK